MMTMQTTSTTTTTTTTGSAAAVPVQPRRRRSVIVRSVSTLGSGSLNEKDQVVTYYCPSPSPSPSPPPFSNTTTKIGRRTSTLSTTTTNTSSSDEEEEYSSSSSRHHVDYQQFDPRTGLPIFNIDQCTDDELLGGEVSPLHPTITRDEELAAVKELRKELTEAEKTELTDPRMLVRHFRAEKGNTARALETLRDALQWRRDFEVTALRVCMQCSYYNEETNNAVKGHKDYQAMMRLENATGKIFVRGTTLEGRAMMYMFAMRNNTHSDHDNMRHLVWNLEKAIRVTYRHSQGRRLDKYCLLIDCANYSLAKAPSMQASKMTLDVLQKHFKERMHRIYVLNPPLAFRMFWKMVKPFIDPVTKTKIVFVTGPDSDGAEQLRKDVGPEQAQRLEPCVFGNSGGGGKNASSSPVPPIRDFDSKEYLELPMDVAFDEKSL